MLTKHEHLLESPFHAYVWGRTYLNRDTPKRAYPRHFFHRHILSLSLSYSLLRLFPSRFLESLTRRSLNIDQRGRHFTLEANGQLVESRATPGRGGPLIRLSSIVASICLITCSRGSRGYVDFRSIKRPSAISFPARTRRCLVRDRKFAQPPQNITPLIISSYFTRMPCGKRQMNRPNLNAYCRK